MSDTRCSYTFDHYREILEIGLEHGYRYRTCVDVSREGFTPQEMLCVLRHDVDERPELAIRFAQLEARLGIRATYFFRTHANEYNCLGYEVLSLMRDIEAMGHEIGLHAEPVDLAAATPMDERTAFQASIRALELALGHPFAGVASHNDWTPDNNLDFFRRTSVAEFGLEYEAYDDDGLGLFARSAYVTDGHMWYWRRFENGELTDDRRCLCAHLGLERRRVYALTHPHAWYDRHFHRRRY